MDDTSAKPTAADSGQSGRAIRFKLDGKSEAKWTDQNAEGAGPAVSNGGVQFGASARAGRGCG